jgi:cytidine deaminase
MARKQTVECTLICHPTHELKPPLQQLVQEALQAQEGSHSPYSHFPVGAALHLASGQMYAASNQENAAYPSGLCAERAALFYAKSQAPQTAIKALAISVSPHSDRLPFPCGSCLQVISEYEQKQEAPIDIYLMHPNGAEVWQAHGVQHLLPFAFGQEHLIG